VSTICLNWMPFDSLATGASIRAMELHRRMPRDLDLTAFTSGGFPQGLRDMAPGIRFRDAASNRLWFNRLREASGGWWKRTLEGQDCGLWVTDTLPVADLPGTRTCLTVHDLRHRASPCYVSWSRFLLLSLCMPSSLRRADTVVAVSGWGAGELRRLYGLDPGRIEVVPNGIDPAFGESEDTGPPFVEPPYILSVGHLEPRKNQELLVRAFAALSRRWTGRLVLAGRDLGSGRGLRRLASGLGLGGRVVFTGRIGRRELLSLYRGCEAVVCPSAYEGFGITLLEAMATGKPVVATAIPPHREVAGEAALLVPTGGGGEAGMAEAITRVLEDDGLAKDLARSGRDRISLFSWDESAAKLGALYRRLLEG
jgi:glycosyltransferase involved in cell wall biosynthesis